MGILDKLDELEYTNDTIIIFTSDHGYSIGEHSEFGKKRLYEIESRVPLIISAPNKPHTFNTKSNHIFGLIDLYKTIISLSDNNVDADTIPVDGLDKSYLFGKNNVKETDPSYSVSIITRCYYNSTQYRFRELPNEYYDNYESIYYSSGNRDCICVSHDEEISIGVS